MDDLLTSMIPVYKELLEDGSLDILIYTGDVDGILPVLGTRVWVTMVSDGVVVMSDSDN